MEGTSEDSHEAGMQANQNGAQAAGKAPLTLADMEKLLNSTEDRIITKVSVQLSADRSVINRHDQTTQHMETSLNDMESRQLTLEVTCVTLSRENETLILKTDDLENRSRHNNIRVTGFPERLKSFQRLLWRYSWQKPLTQRPFLPSVKRAHRVAISHRRQKDLPRPFIARIPGYQDKEHILKLARESGPLSFRGSEIHIKPDYSYSRD